jgi:hypothetical protein
MLGAQSEQSELVSIADAATEPEPFTFSITEYLPGASDNLSCANRR